MTNTSSAPAIIEDATNESRARWAGAAIDAFTKATGCDLENALADLLADLMHWCDRNATDFNDELDQARDYYNQELGDESEAHNGSV